MSWAEVSATRYKPWANPSSDYSDVLARHESRYRNNLSFGLLLDELKSQREARTENQITLVESVRKQEISEQESDGEQRLELVRKAFGAAGRNDDGDNPAEQYPDVILDEAANVLADILAQQG